MLLYYRPPFRPIRLLFLSLFFLAAIDNIFAQRFTISGYVEDAATGERLISASVYEPVSLKGVSTNKFGYFSLTFSEKIDRILVSYAGFRTTEIRIPALRDTSVIVKLNADLMLDEVIVEAESGRTIEKRTEMSVIQVPVSQMQKIPAIAGEVDIIKALQLMPGVQRGTEGSAGFFVRGGTPDQNLILLDGVPVYNANHLFGFFSVFNSDALRNVTLHKGGFPARFGGRLSSVLEIDMKEGNNQEFAGSVSLGLIASRFLLEGPTVKNKGSVLVSARRTYIDVLTRPLQERSNTPESRSQSGYYFYDMTAKINHTFSDRSRAFLSLYTGLDEFYNDSYGHVTDFSRTFEQKTEDNNSLGWGNLTGTFRWTYLLSDKLFLTSMATVSNYSFGLKSNFSTETIRRFPLERPPREEKTTSYSRMENSSGVRDYAVQSTLDYLPRPGLTLRFGAAHIWHTYSPEATQIANSDEDILNEQEFRSSPDLKAQESGLFAEQEWVLSPEFSINPGVRLSGYFANGESFFGLEPRIAARYQISSTSSLKASYAFMKQYVHLLTNVSISLPTDLWIPSSNGVNPQNGHHFGLGYSRNLPKNGLEFSVEGYYKRMNNLVEYKEGTQFLAGSKPLYEQLETDGTGWSYGTEWLLQKKQGRTTGWIGYTLSWSWRRFDAFDLGEKYPFKYDRRHDVSVVVSHTVRKGFDVTASWVYNTGTALTLPRKKYVAGEVPGQPVYSPEVPVYVQHYGGRNSFRSPAYHRLDASAQFTKKKRNGTRVWSFGAYNAYSRMNPFYVYVRQTERNTRVSQISLFPIIPGISYQYAF